MVDISSRMMLVNLRINVWDGRKLDKKVTKQTIEDHGIKASDALRVNKLVLAKEFFQPVKDATVKARDFMQARTYPWYDKGWRGLMRNGYMPFVEALKDVETEWYEAVDKTMDNYPAARALAEFRMVGAYDPNDYPGEAELRSRYRFTFDIAPVGTSEDFRVKLDDVTLSEIKDKLNEANDQRILAAQKDVWERVDELVTHFAARTSPDIGKFYDTVVTNLQDLVAVLPSLNIAADPNLKAIGQRLRDTLCAYEPNDLRKHLDVRATAKAEAEKIMADMKGFMDAFKT